MEEISSVASTTTRHPRRLKQNNKCSRFGVMQGDPLWWFAGVLCFFHCSEFALAWTFSRHEVSWSCACTIPLPSRFALPRAASPHPASRRRVSLVAIRIHPHASPCLFMRGKPPTWQRNPKLVATVSSHPLYAHRTHDRGYGVARNGGGIAAWLFSTHYCVAMGCACIEHLLWRALWPSMQQSQAARAISTMGFAFVVLGELVRKAGYVCPSPYIPAPKRPCDGDGHVCVADGARADGRGADHRRR